MGRSEDVSREGFEPASRGLTRRRILAGGAGLGVVGLLAACTPTSTAPATTAPDAPAKTDTLKAAMSDLGTQAADPHLGLVQAGGYPIVWAGEPLVYRGLDAKFAPGLATAWSISPDGLTWTFTLRPNVKMQDGSTFTGRDIETAVKRVNGSSFPVTSQRALVSSITSIKIIDETHVAITTKTPYGGLLDDLPVPIPTAYYERVGEEGFKKQPLHAGAFQFVSQVQNQNMVFKRYDDFWDASRKPNFKTLELQIVPEESARVAAILSGSVDIADGLGAASVQQLAGRQGVRLIRNDTTTIINLRFADLLNPDVPHPALDLRIRQALMYALDRKAIAETVYRGIGSFGSNLYLPTTPGYDASLQSYPYDPEKARQLVRAAGFGGGFPFDLWIRNPDATIPNSPALAQAMGSYWEAIGAKVNLQIADAAVVAQVQRSGKMSGVRITGFPGYVLWDPQFLPGSNLYSKAANTLCKDPQLDKLYLALEAAVEPSAREKAALAMTRYLYDTIPQAQIVGLASVLAVGPNVRDYKMQAGNPLFGPWHSLRAN